MLCRLPLDSSLFVEEAEELDDRSEVTLDDPSDVSEEDPLSLVEAGKLLPEEESLELDCGDREVVCDDDESVGLEDENESSDDVGDDWSDELKELEDWSSEDEKGVVLNELLELKKELDWPPASNSEEDSVNDWNVDDGASLKDDSANDVLLSARLINWA